MGSSTGNMLVDKQQTLEHIFKTCKLPLMAHCEDTDIINRNMAEVKQAWGDDPQVSLHPLIRSEEACLASSRKAAELAKKYGTRLHIAHVSTAVQKLSTYFLGKMRIHMIAAPEEEIIVSKDKVATVKRWLDS